MSGSALVTRNDLRYGHVMTSKPKPDDPEQSKRFIKTAREIGAAETEKEAERALKEIDLRKADHPQKTENREPRDQNHSRRKRGAGPAR